MLVVELKRKPKNISCSSFACWELSRVNSFYFFFFLWGSRRLYWKCLVALICMIDYLTKSPYYLSSLLSWMLVDSSLVQCTYTLIIINIVRSCKWKAIMTIYDGLIGKRKAGMNSTSLVFVNMMIHRSWFSYYEVNIFAMTFRDYSYLCHTWLDMSYNGLPCVPTCY